ncbi:MAG TPA: polyphosphate:AMP phosphotransferase [Candidatus Hydrogenedentes bacterium]|nr:polyphosphate:AMP phosphotransferase [Candidatus Hydrogenedentota bacterium]HPG69370.1 polyphosphate:AMP phosphotransferase [Candidatus Hydrogenedentota bacterium]
MLETIDLKAKLSKSEYKEALERLDLRLPELQRELRDAGIPSLVVFEGWDAAGKGSVLGRLLQPLDPRGFKVHNIKGTTDEERMRPPMRIFWLLLPAQGTMAIFNHSWYRQVLSERVENGGPTERLRAAYERIRVLEHQLTDEGMVIVKLFLHISKKEQARRFKQMREDPAFAWKVGKEERRRHKHYEAYYEASEDMLRETSTSHAPWTIVPATDERFALVKVAETLSLAFENAAQAARCGKPSAPKPASRRTSPLDRVDLTLATPPETYDKELPKLQGELRRLQHRCYVRRVPVVIVYEGWDAAGKGGNIRRLTRELDPRGYEVVPVAAPEGEEKTHHYLWRFWRALPKAGHITIFDRSWYGRVLVERIEEFAQPRDWMRAYREINEFEAQLSEFGMVVVKFWLHISKQEQLRRFKDREQSPYKQWKITDEDWRNRERWNDYWIAVSDMIEQTSTVHAPWTIVEANDKLFARLKTLQVVTERIKKALNALDLPA